MKGSFRSLRGYNFRLWAAGSLVSNIGTWFQRIAQDWLVLTQLTHHSALAVGIVSALQTGPTLLLLPATGYVADRFDRRKLMIATQAASAAIALVLGLLTVFGLVRLWHVYIFALVFGCVSAFDGPARQTFVGELVGDADLANATALNSTSFNAARMIGPALAGALIAAVGSGWAIILNGLSFAAVLGSLLMLRLGELHGTKRRRAGHGGLSDGFRYISGRPDLRVVVLMIGLIGSFGLNFPIFISTMSVSVFHVGASHYGLFMSIMAAGSIAGSLVAVRQEEPSIRYLAAGVGVFAIGFLLAALAPGFWLFGAGLVILGVSSVSFTTSTNSFMQLMTEPTMRGRVLAIRLAVGSGGTLVGAPFVGWVADSYGPRWAGGVGVAAGVAAGLVALNYLIRRHGLRAVLQGRGARVQTDEKRAESEREPA